MFDQLKEPIILRKEILERIILASTNENDLILDPFCGSSTTGIATNKLNRKYVGIDNSKEYLDLSIKVVDTQKPDIFLTNTSNKIISDHVLTDDELKSLFVVTDNYDTIPNTKITIKDNPCDGTQGKDFEIIVTVSDNSGNSCEKTFLYYLTDTEKPIINVSNTIYVEIGTNLTNEQFIDLLKEVGAIPADATSVTIDEEIENGNSTVVNYTTTFSDGTTKTGSITIEYFTRENKNIENIPLLIILSITALTMIGCGLIGFKKKKN